MINSLDELKRVLEAQMEQAEVLTWDECVELRKFLSTTVHHTWCIEDVRTAVAEDLEEKQYELTDEQCVAILEEFSSTLNSDIGLNWEGLMGDSGELRSTKRIKTGGLMDREIKLRERVYLLEDSKTLEVELSIEDFDELTEGDDANKWDTLKELASLSAGDAPDLIFYVGGEHLAHLEASGELTETMLGLLKHAKACGAQYLKIYA